MPSYYTHGRYTKPLTWVQIMRLTRFYWRRIKSPFAFALGFAIPSLFFYFDQPQAEQEIINVNLIKEYQNYKIESFYKLGSETNYTLKDPESDKTITTIDLIKKGINVQPLTSCRVLLIQGDHHADINCS